VDEVATVTTMLLDGALVAVAERGDALDGDAVRDCVVRSVWRSAACTLRRASIVHVQPQTVAVIPVRALEGAKSRLGAVLDAEERRELVERLLRATVEAAMATPGVTRVLVVSPDPEVLAVGAAAGASGIRQASAGLNPGLLEARDAPQAAGADRLLVLPGDLPGIAPADIGALIRAADAADAVTPVGMPLRLVVLATDRHGRGTNALLLQPPRVIDPSFGGDSRDAHRRLAAAAGATYVEIPDVLELDLDTPDDLLLLESLRPEALSAG
jgi:2-phospho-L-lactate guanylyltransferase